MCHIENETGNFLIGIENQNTCPLEKPVKYAEYLVLHIHNGSGSYHADFSAFEFSGPTLLFATPLQTIRLQYDAPIKYSILRFHTDFYCIETHREEVACNGLLFNNIYMQPSVLLSEKEHISFCQLFEQMLEELTLITGTPIVIRAYLQLLLAKCSSIKIKSMESAELNLPKDEKMEQFRVLLDENYLALRKPADYAKLLYITANALSKKSVRYFAKSPSQLIQERLILEAKKMLHLTAHSIKEISFMLKFSDEYYFSRFFKKHTGVSPQLFRNKGGRAELANLFNEDPVHYISGTNYIN